MANDLRTSLLFCLAAACLIACGCNSPNARSAEGSGGSSGSSAAGGSGGGAGAGGTGGNSGTLGNGGTGGTQGDAGSWWRRSDGWTPIDAASVLGTGCRVYVASSPTIAPPLVQRECGDGCSSLNPPNDASIFSPTLDQRLIRGASVPLMTATHVYDSEIGSTFVVQTFRLDNGESMAAVRIDAAVGTDGTLECSPTVYKQAATLIAVIGGSPPRIAEGALDLESLAWTFVNPPSTFDDFMRLCSRSHLDSLNEMIYACGGGMWQRNLSSGSQIVPLVSNGVQSAAARGAHLAWIATDPAGVAHAWRTIGDDRPISLGSLEGSVCAVGVGNDVTFGFSGIDVGGMGCSGWLSDAKLWSATSEGIRMSEVLSSKSVGVSALTGDEYFVAAQLFGGPDSSWSSRVAVARRSDWSIRQVVFPEGAVPPPSGSISVANASIYIALVEPGTGVLKQVLRRSLEPFASFGERWGN